MSVPSADSTLTTIRRLEALEAQALRNYVDASTAVVFANGKIEDLAEAALALGEIRGMLAVLNQYLDVAIKTEMENDGE